MKKFTVAIAAAACLGIGAFGFTACNEENDHMYNDDGVVVVAPTCSEGGYTQHNCADCDYFYRDSFTDPTGVHTPVTDRGVAATCAESGLTDGSHCEVCGKVLVEQQTVAATGNHTAVTDEGYDPICTKDGLTDGSHCKVCGETLVEQQTVHTQGHVFRYTTDQGGLTHSGECINCDEKISNEAHVYGGGACLKCESEENADFEFKLADDNAHYIVAGLKSDKKDIVIPSVHNNLPVTEINRLAFRNSEITSAVIPESVTEIGASAFYNSTIESVSLPSGIVEIGRNAFNRCFELKTNDLDGCHYLGNAKAPYLYLKDFDYDCGKIDLPAETRVIEQNIIASLPFTDVTVSPVNTVFTKTQNCLINTLTETLILGNGESVIPAGGIVKIIGSDAFDNPFEDFNVEIPDGVEIIKQFAFSRSKIKSLHIPASVKVIEQGAFWATEEMTEITVDEANENYYVKDNCLIEKTTKIMIKGCTGSVIPSNDGITTVADYAFTGIGLTSLVLPDTATSVGIAAFNSCTKLTEIDLGAGMTSLERLSFSGCEKLTAMFMPATVRLIRTQAFRHCRVTVYFNGNSSVWDKIEKEDGWDKEADITVVCTDKTLTYLNYTA
ncbi:MAG: leucine-rich repeat domain-containing protein [Roseburia sp.]|nr:leucine-rich repeat domain-containing protein [Roseburia sp.]